MTLSKYNYLLTLYLFLHYLGGSGITVFIDVPREYQFIAMNTVYRLRADYLALGHFDYFKRNDVYDFNEGEWPKWLINLGKPFTIVW